MQKTESLCLKRKTVLERYWINCCWLSRNAKNA